MGLGLFLESIKWFLTNGLLMVLRKEELWWRRREVLLLKG
jgi:hypothetical protein